VLEQHLPRARSKGDKLQDELAAKAKELADAQQQLADQVRSFLLAVAMTAFFLFSETWL
jgi:hypothetical protein